MIKIDKNEIICHLDKRFSKTTVNNIAEMIILEAAEVFGYEKYDEDKLKDFIADMIKTNKYEDVVYAAFYETGLFDPDEQHDYNNQYITYHECVVEPDEYDDKPDWYDEDFMSDDEIYEAHMFDLPHFKYVEEINDYEDCPKTVLEYIDKVDNFDETLKLMLEKHISLERFNDYSNSEKSKITKEFTNRIQETSYGFVFDATQYDGLTKF